MVIKRTFIVVVLIALVSVLLPRSIAPAYAQATDSVTVSDQTIINNWIWVDKVVAKQAGWIAIHASSDGFPVVGETYVHPGENDAVGVQIDMDKATPTMSAMLHVDAGKLGVYEFPGPDAPVMGTDNKPINPPFKVLGVDVDDQLLDGTTVTVGKVIAQQDGWIAIHTSATGFPVIGFAPIKAGINEKVSVTIDPKKATDRMTAMIHIDAGKIGTYEFPGPDAPAMIGTAIVNNSFWISDWVRVQSQFLADDNSLTIPYVLAKKDGWMVIHSTAKGNPAIGHAAVKQGLNQAVKVTIDDPKTLTPVVLAMLHIDAGKIGTYEFPGPDAPVTDSAGAVIAPMMLAQEGVLVRDQGADIIKKNGTVQVDWVLAKQPGWIAIHSSAKGFPVIGHTYVPAGLSFFVKVPVDVKGLTDPVTAMLHLDAGTPGVYEFPGPDAPVMGADGKPINPPIKTGGTGMGSAMKSAQN